MDAGDAYRDLGPTLPPRGEIYAKAVRLEELARLARELSSAGPSADLPRAVKTLDKAHALLGGGGCNAQ